MTSVTEILNTGYKLHQVAVLPVPYTVLELPHKKVAKKTKPSKSVVNAVEAAKTLLQRTIQPPAPVIKGAKPPVISATDYRHIVCSRLAELRPLLPCSVS